MTSPAFNFFGTLPSGVTFNPMSGLLSGTPAFNFFGTYPVTFTASKGVGSNAVQNFRLIVNPSADDVKSGGEVETQGGSYKISFVGNPGQHYTVQYNSDLVPANWQFHSVQVAAANGTFSIIDNPPAGTTPRFYRAIVP